MYLYTVVKDNILLNPIINTNVLPIGQEFGENTDNSSRIVRCLENKVWQFGKICETFLLPNFHPTCMVYNIICTLCRGKKRKEKRDMDGSNISLISTVVMMIPT